MSAYESWPLRDSLTDLGSVSDFPASLKQLDASHNQISQWPEPATYWLGDALVPDGLAEERRCYAAGDTNKYIVSIPGECSVLTSFSSYCVALWPLMKSYHRLLGFSRKTSQQD